MKITKIYYDFIQTQSGACKDYMLAEVGKPFTSQNGSDEYNNVKVVSIQEHRAAGGDDKWFYDIKLENNNVVRIFNINTVFYQNAT